MARLEAADAAASTAVAPTNASNLKQETAEQSDLSVQQQEQSPPHPGIASEPGAAPLECPLGYGRGPKAASYDHLPRMTLAALALHAGQYAENSHGSTCPGSTAVGAKESDKEIADSKESDKESAKGAMPRLVCVKGKVHDVSTSAAFLPQGLLAPLVGHESSRAIALGDFTVSLTSVTV